MPFKDPQKDKDYHSKWHENHPEQIRIAALRRQWRIKTAVLSYYSGGGEPHCVICGEKDMRVLQLDHINGGGSRERQKAKKSDHAGHRFYDWVIKNGFPEGYQTLCANCNTRKMFVELNLYFGLQGVN